MFAIVLRVMWQNMNEIWTHPIEKSFREKGNGKQDNRKSTVTTFDQAVTELLPEKILCKNMAAARVLLWVIGSEMNEIGTHLIAKPRSEDEWTDKGGNGKLSAWETAKFWRRHEGFDTARKNRPANTKIGESRMPQSGRNGRLSSALYECYYGKIEVLQFQK